MPKQVCFFVKIYYLILKSYNSQEMLDAAAAGEDGYEVTELTPEEFEVRIFKNM